MQCLWRISVFMQHEYVTTKFLFSSRNWQFQSEFEKDERSFAAYIHSPKMYDPPPLPPKKRCLFPFYVPNAHIQRGEKKGIATLLLHCNVVVNRRCCSQLHFHLKSIHFQSKQWASQNSKRIECTRSMQKVRLLETVPVFGTNWWRSLSPRRRRDYSSHGFLLAQLQAGIILCPPLQNWMQ